MSQYWVELGAYFKSLRERKNLSLKDVSDRFKISKTALYQYENGMRKIPMKLIDELCKFYGVSMADTFVAMSKYI